jgi:hypothetical protein
MHEKVQCTQCHIKPVFTNVGKNCEDCHADIHQRKMGTDCAQCHTVQGWNNSVQQVKDHQNRFPLLGAHAAVQCEDCHKGAAVGQYQGLSTACISCHQTDFQKATNPNHVSAQFPQTCETCHTFDSWLGAKFDHSTTGFLLTNGHANVPCASCHINNNYNLKIAPTDCGNSQCHLTTWQQTSNPKHSSSPNVFPVATCSTCHTTVSWLTATFDHSTTGFPLANSHQMAPAGKVNACTDCHINSNYNLTIQPTDCGNSQCHLNTNYGGGWQGTNNPVHSTSGPTFAAANCSNCHNTISFLTATFDHSTTGFPLANSHQMAPAGKVSACTDCHINNNYTLTIGPTDCGNSQCHLNTNYGGGWQGTNNPVHSTAGTAFAATNCSNCHNTVSFLTATFDHSTTGWPLLGSHQMAPAGKVNLCTDCHVNNNYTFTSANTDCYGCHQAAWNSTPTFGGAVPNHITAGFPTSLCSQCHDTIVWTDSTFNHANTGFPLQNSHQISPAGKVTGCDQCHLGNYSTLAIQPTDCGNSGCHLNTNYGGGWQGTNNPVHSTAGAPFAAVNCSNCHNTISFLTATFDHSTTGWPLLGSHQLAPAGKVNLCSDCHVNNNYTFTSANTDCYGCHQTAWNSTPTFGGAVPNHITAGFPTSLCSQCHDTIVWTDSTFNHANTGFPLTNSHQIAPAGKVTGCDQCHVGNYSTLAIQPTDCGNSQCHLTTYNGTNNPVHSTAGAPFAIANCSTCHNTITWTTATFDHSTTGFPLTGSHQLAPAGKVNLCSDCHIGNNYTAGFPPMDCGNSQCHLKDWNNTPTFGGNVPNHITAGFPISLCSTCHDTLLWTDGKFDHSTTGFPLQGPHMLPPRTAVTGAIGPMVNACTDCHIGGNYATGYPTTDCYSCHTTYYTNAQTYSTTAPNHVAANYPTTCVACHTTYVTTAWLGAVFNHTYFRIPHHASVCGDCHIVSTDYSQFACTSCHTVPTAHRPGMSHPNVNGYIPPPQPGSATVCYNCHKG